MFLLPSSCTQCGTLHFKFPVRISQYALKVTASDHVKNQADLRQSAANEPLIESQNIGAFFDIDNTIMRGASIFHLARGLFARKFLSATDLANFAIAQGKFLTYGSENLADMARITENALSFVTGRSVEQVTALSEEIFDEIMADKIWPGTVQLAQIHLAAGHQVWLVSAAPIELANIIATKLGLSGAIATVSEIENGKYTGKLKNPPMHGEQKALAVSQLAEEKGINLDHSFAYSDSSNDIPLLSSVGNPTAINPDSTLRNHANSHNWPIHDFRRQRLVKRYGIPVGATAIALVGAGAGLAIAATRRSRA
jgi:HAD superfamily hydrolase (TIGR01490 family)